MTEIGFARRFRENDFSALQKIQIEAVALRRKADVENFLKEIRKIK